ncbi:MAG: lactate racemase domain-containing protein, partial [Candidatus Thermoplasmatota archaeon]
MEVIFPYGKSKLGIDIPEKNILEIVEANEISIKNEEEIIEKAIDREKLKKFKGKIAIVVDDKTRPCPTKKILPYIT